MPTHLECYDRKRQNEADPKPTAHIDELGIRTCFSRCKHRLQCHPADRARARPDLTNLRMHRARIDSALGNVFGALG